MLGDTWNLKTTLSDPRHDYTKLVFKGQMVVLGGRNVSAPFQNGLVSSDGLTWTEFTPKGVFPDAHYKGAAEKYGGIVVSGGLNINLPGFVDDGVWQAKKLSKPFKRVSTLPQPLFGHKMVRYKGILYVLGGTPNGFAPSQKIYAGKGKKLSGWAEFGTDFMPIPLFQFGMVKFNGKVWISGGLSVGFTVQNKVYSSTDLKTWSLEGELPVELHSHSMVTVGDTMYVLGGIRQGVNSSSKKVFKSFDGVLWEEVEVDALPFKSGADSFYSFKDALWLVGGWKLFTGSVDTVYRSPQTI